MMQKLQKLSVDMQGQMESQMANMRVGFEAIGKIKGAEAKLFVMGARRLMLRITEGYQQDSYVFFSSLTPHRAHRHGRGRRHRPVAQVPTGRHAAPRGVVRGVGVRRLGDRDGDRFREHRNVDGL